MPDSDKPLRVKILDREYSLRVSPEDEAHTREIASYLDSKMRGFKNAHPDQNEVTSAVITALAITEELFAVQEVLEANFGTLETELNRLDSVLANALHSTNGKAIVETE